MKASHPQATVASAIVAELRCFLRMSTRRAKHSRAAMFRKLFGKKSGARRISAINLRTNNSVNFQIGLGLPRATKQPTSSNFVQSRCNERSPFAEHD
jgi:hypothetical protein